ncbi:uncharacterized protein HMPREF1541_02675 [Cyphellophora europaea CBS 101466]|uniref:Uncharacterized protein n=1 Tax=Cyphellophora europaea (strain CBS 101466) TaxID=1220924 RepID=W2S486_CYPE1|nr:uncharacterized protein HMPREF1541_02675 [Cyphellophora europaea CBS 101466]ETN43516.1 hypothetical protein HMPREF1541_02675 [Cyphellophora europaea CBS 101466]
MVETVSIAAFISWLGDPIEDASEETFFLFSESLPSNNLGFIDSRAQELDLDVAGQSITLKQSPGLLNSQRDTGTTGAVLWKITPLVAAWLASSVSALHRAGVLRANSIVVELGCGITGLIGILVAPSISSYVLTDQTYIMKTLRENITANASTPGEQRRKGTRHVLARPSTVPLDWETDTPSLDGLGLQTDQMIDLVIVCDCVYNEYLIKPLVVTLEDISRLNRDGYSTTILIAQQLRSETIFEQFLAALMASFAVWRLRDEDLPENLQMGSGYAVHLALPKPKP